MLNRIAPKDRERLARAIRNTMRTRQKQKASCS